MKVDKKYKGLVTKKFNEFYLVELDKDEDSEFNKKFLCKIKKSVNFRNQFDKQSLHPQRNRIGF